MAARIYMVTSADGAERYLVRANTPAQARNHVTANLYTVTVPDQDELYSAAADGVKVETAGEVS